MIPESTRGSSPAEELARGLARGTSDLPTLPRSATEALRLAKTPSVDFDELARVAEQDPPLAARLVSVANSAAYAPVGRARIASVRQAAVRIGTQATRDILYQVAYSSIFVDTPRFRERVEATFEHGASTARLARVFAGKVGVDPDTAFLAALLHDLGRARCWKLLAKRHNPGDDPAALAAAVSALHASAGADLASAWRLPEGVVEACRHHHAPSGRIVALLVAAADSLSPLDEPGEGDVDARGCLLEAGVPEPEVDGLLREGTPTIASRAGG